MTVRSSFIERRERQFLDEQLHSRAIGTAISAPTTSATPRPKDGDDSDTRGYLHGPG